MVIDSKMHPFTAIALANETKSDGGVSWYPRLISVGDIVQGNGDHPNTTKNTERKPMLFLTYWKLNEDMSVEERQEVAQRLTSSGLFPPDDVEIIRWDGTPDGWGIVLAEADSADAIGNMINMWRIAGDGFFEETVTAPALPVQEALEQTQELFDAVASAD